LYPSPRTSAHQAPQEVLNVVWSVREAFLEAALHAVDTDFGGVTRYLQDALAVGPREQARLAQLYLSAA
ncbi:MAG: tyrosine-protein phosphatase, partial [Rhodoferax sp.]